MSEQPEMTPVPPHLRSGLVMLGEGGRALVTAAATFVVIFGLRYTRDFCVPVVLAAFLAIISYPITVALRRFLRMPHWLAVTFTVFFDIGILYGLVSFIKFLAADVKITLQGDFLQHVQEKFSAFLTWTDQLGVGDYARELIKSPQSLVDTQQLIALSQSITAQVLSFMSITTLVLILMTFILGEAPLFYRNLNRLPNSLQGKDKVISALRGVQKYLIIKTLASVSTGLLAWGLCHAMEVPFAFMWGFVACVLNYIPTIGSVVAAVPPILLALLLRDWGTMFIVAGGYLAINFAIGNGIEPLFLGKQFGIATTVVLFSVLIWGWIWGPLGMLLAVPFTVLLKLALENSVDLNWVAAIIDDNPHPDSTPSDKN